MPVFPQGSIQKYEVAGAVAASSRGTILTSHASAHTLATSYTELIASTGLAAVGFSVFLTTGTTLIDYFIDIAIGAASSEQVIVTNLLATGASGAGNNYVYNFPLTAIPKGSRVSARCRASTGSSVITISIQLYAGGFNQAETGTYCDTIGAETGDTSGISIDPGGSINTEGAWTQIVASTSRATRHMLLAIGNQKNSTRTTCRWLVDIAIGPATETEIISDIAIDCHATFDSILPGVIPLPYAIPAGTRISVRARCSINDATDRLFDVVMYLIG